MRAAIFLITLILALSAAAHAQPFTDTFDTLEPWSVIASDGVQASIAQDTGPDGPCLRLDFNFEAGAGYCIVRRALPIDLPANYRFTHLIRGEAPDNNLEFKLVDGDNVWWINRRAFQFPKEWTKITNKASHFQFAWGPSGGAKLDRLGAIEVAIAAAKGGKGSVYIDTLTFEALPEPLPVTHDPIASFSSASGDNAPVTIPASGAVAWRSAPTDNSPRIDIDFQQPREVGGLILDWDSADFGVNYDISLSPDGQTWEQATTARASDGGRDFIALPDGEGTHLRIDIRSTSRNQGAGLTGLALQSPEFANTPNAFITSIAKASPRGRYPRAFLREQPVWTVVGAPESPDEALFSGDGAIEVFKGGPSIEPFVMLDTPEGPRRLSWADAKITQSLDSGYLPIPTVSWDLGGLRLDITPIADVSLTGRVPVKYTLTNTGGPTQSGQLSLMVRPFQVLPPWQELNLTGGVTPIRTIEHRAGSVLVNERLIASAVTPADRFIAAAFHSADPVAMLSEFGEIFERADDPAGLASGILSWRFDLPAGSSKEVVLDISLNGWSRFGFGPPPGVDVVATQYESRRRWSADLNKVTLSLPPSAQHLADTFRTIQAHILINADGPAIQPGSRTYERSWIRDGALTSTALLATGHPEQARAFIDWYAGYQYPSGKIPCVVDSRGPDPVPEHDSTGEYLYIVHTYYRFTRDAAFLEHHWPHVQRAIGYIESLRAERMTDEYKNGPPEKRACYGLVPESISHEGYSAKPMHSYWDDFFILKGLEDAAAIAAILNKSDEHTRWTALAADFKRCLYDSMRLAMQIKNIDYIPGCVELGDFDATSTAIGLYPCDQYGSIPEPQLSNTFDRYYDYFQKRRDGQIDWKDYTPYEVRLIGTFIRLGQPDRAHNLLDYFLSQQTPPAWNQWPEVVARDGAKPHFVGDIPHTWVGSDFLSAVRSMFVYEHNDGLILAAGITPEWAATPEGVAIKNFPTEFGAISYSLRTVGDTTTINLNLDLFEFPPAGITIRAPDPRPIAAATIDGKVVHTDPQQLHLTAPASTVTLQYESP
jgi:hypothetical protein